MPFSSVSQLKRRIPKQVDDLSPREKRIFLEVFNSAHRRGASESSAFAQAHAVARGKAKKKRRRRRRG